MKTNEEKPSKLQFYFTSAASTYYLVPCHAQNNFGFDAKQPYFLPLSSGQSPAKTAATPDAPPPSTTAFSISIHRRIAMETHSSETLKLRNNH